MKSKEKIQLTERLQHRSKSKFVESKRQLFDMTFMSSTSKNTAKSINKKIPNLKIEEIPAINLNHISSPRIPKKVQTNKIA